MVFDNDLKNITLVLEYNGPWHYRLIDNLNRADEPATPYKNSKTISETYVLDILKLNTIKNKCSNILIFWEDSKELIKYNGYEL